MWDPTKCDQGLECLGPFSTYHQTKDDMDVSSSIFPNDNISYTNFKCVKPYECAPKIPGIWG